METTPSLGILQYLVVRMPMASLCKICEEYSETSNEFWKSKAHAYDEHPDKMLVTAPSSW